MGNSDKSNCTELIPVPSPRLVRRGDVGNGVPDRDSALHAPPKQSFRDDDNAGPGCRQVRDVLRGLLSTPRGERRSKMQVSRDG